MTTFGQQGKIVETAPAEEQLVPPADYCAPDGDDNDVPPDVAKVLAEVHRTMGKPLLTCWMGEASVGEIQERVGRPLPTISLHLHKLADRGVLRSRIVGTRTYYALRSSQIAALVASIRINYLN